MMAKKFTPFIEVRKTLIETPPGQDLLVVVATQECPACTQQHYENEKAAFSRPSLKRYFVEAHEWNQTVPQENHVKQVPEIYLGNNQEGLKYIRTGVMERDELLHVLP